MFGSLGEGGIFLSKPSFFQLYIDNRAQFELLSNVQAGRLIKALFHYAESGLLPDFSNDQGLQITFSFLKANIDREFENYHKRCEKNRESAKKRYASACQGRQEEKEKEKEKEKKNKDEKEDEIEMFELIEIQDCFNQTCSSLTRVNKLTSKRRNAIKTVLREWSADELCHAFELVAQSSFLCGKNGKWKANFDWILKPDNLIRILEGSYADYGDGADSSTGAGRSYDIEELEQINRMDGY